MIIKRTESNAIKSSEITEKTLFQHRREFLVGGAAVALGLSLPNLGNAVRASRNNPA